ncbi:uncharacterized protein LOC144356288 [Saccoglossus kowalevskii]
MNSLHANTDIDCQPGIFNKVPQQGTSQTIPSRCVKEETTEKLHMPKDSIVGVRCGDLTEVRDGNTEILPIEDLSCQSADKDVSERNEECSIDASRYGGSEDEVRNVTKLREDEQGELCVMELIEQCPDGSLDVNGKVTIGEGGDDRTMMEYGRPEGELCVRELIEQCPDGSLDVNAKVTIGEGGDDRTMMESGRPDNKLETEEQVKKIFVWMVGEKLEENESNAVVMDYSSNSRHLGDCSIIQCLRCGLLFSSQEALDDHEKIHKESDPYQCGVCQQVFSENTIGPHMQSHSDNHYEVPQRQITIKKPLHAQAPAKRLKCSSCERTFRCQRGLTTHIKVKVITKEKL